MPDRTTVLRARSAVMSPLQRSKTRPQSPEHVPQLCPFFRESRQDHSPQSTFHSYAPSSENQDRTTVPRVRSTVMPLFQRIKTGPQSPEYVPQLCPLFRVARQGHSPQNTFLSYAPSSENQDRTSIPRAHSTVQRSQTGPQSPEHVLQLCPFFRVARQSHSPRGTFCSYDLSSEKQGRPIVPIRHSTVKRSQTGPQSPEHVLQLCPFLREIKTRPQSPGHVPQLCPLFREARQHHSRRVRSTVMSPLRRSQTTARAPWSIAARTAAGKQGGPSEDFSHHPNHRTD